MKNNARFFKTAGVIFFTRHMSAFNLVFVWSSKPKLLGTLPTMKSKWWKSPEIILFYGALGAIVGAFLGIVLQGYLFRWTVKIFDAGDGFRTLYSGVSGIGLIAEAATFDIALGSMTGCALVHAKGKYRLVCGVLLIFFSMLAALASVSRGLDAISIDGGRFVLAFNGIYFVWSILLFIFGWYLVSRPHTSNSKTKARAF